MKKIFAFVAVAFFALTMNAQAIDTLTCADAAAAALAGDTSEVYVKGYVTNIAYAWKNGSMSFWMADSVNGGNVFEAYNCAVDSALAPEVTDLVVAHGKLAKFNTTPELAKGCTVEIIEKGEGPDTVIIDVTNCATAAQAALSVAGNNVPYNNGAEYTVTGYVTSIQNAWASGTMTFWMADAQDGGNVLEAYKCAIADQADAPNVGDKVSVTGQLTKYNTTPEFAQGCTCVVLERGDAPQNLGYKTIAEFLEMQNRKDTCILRGAIANIKMDSSDPTQYNVYGNFDLVDATATVYIYGLLTPDGVAKKFREMGLNAGDSISVKAIYNEYQGNPQVVNAILIQESIKMDTVNVAQAMEIGMALGDNESTTKNYAIAGYVAKVKTAYSDQFKNITFYMTDDPEGTYGDLQIYRGAISQEEGEALAQGDRVLVVGKLKHSVFQSGGETKEAVETLAGAQVTVEWKQAIENILINDTKINKVIVDGVVYIVRDGKMYNVNGAQVR